MSSLSNIVKTEAGHMPLVLRNLREYRNKYSATDSFGVSATTFT